MKAIKLMGRLCRVVSESQIMCIIIFCLLVCLMLPDVTMDETLSILKTLCTIYMVGVVFGAGFKASK